MDVTRANVEATKAYLRQRLGNPYIYAGALSPSNVKQGTDCSEVVQTAAELVLGRYVPGRQAEGATTESYRVRPGGGLINVGEVGPFGTIRVARPQDIPAGAPLKIALHHGGGGPNSHMWCEVDGMRIESRGGGVGLITQPRAFAINDPYANAWFYLPGKIVDDGTPIPPPAPEVVILGQRYESGGDRVRALQLALNTALGANLDPDGEFGPLTEAAVITFQRSRNLEADGVAGPITLAALGLKFGTAQPDTAPRDLVALFRRIMTPTEQNNARLAELLPHYIEARRAAEITTVRRAAAFDSQLGHEGAGGKYMAEIETSNPSWSWDRTRYRGRGPIQLTWMSNYRKFGVWCKAKGYVTDSELFVNQPELVEQPRWGYLAASWYWLNAGPRPGQINAFADAGDIEAVSRCVNGWIENDDGSLRTPIGMADRRTRYLNCLALGDQLLTLTAPAAPSNPIEELLMSNQRVPSASPYATAGEPDIDVMEMFRAMDAELHISRVERAARRGNDKELARLVRTARGQGKYRDQDTIDLAIGALAEIDGKTVEEIEQLLKGSPA